MFPPLLNFHLGGLNTKTDFVKSRYSVTECVTGKWCTMHWQEQSGRAHTVKVNVLPFMISQVHCSCSDLPASDNQIF